MPNTTIDMRCARGIWLLTTNAGVLGGSPGGATPIGTLQFLQSQQPPLDTGLMALPVAAINNCFTVLFQLVTQEEQYQLFPGVDLQWTTSRDAAARFSFVPTGSDGLNQYLLAVFDGASNPLGYLGADGSTGAAKLVQSQGDALVTTLAARLPTKHAPFDDLLPGEVMLYDGPNFTGNRVVVLDGSQNLAVLPRLGVLQAIVSLRPGPQTVVTVSSTVSPCWQPVSLSMQHTPLGVSTQVAVYPGSFTGAWALQVFNGGFATKSNNGLLATRPASGALTDSDFLWFYAAPPPANPLLSAPVVQLWNNPSDLSLAYGCAIQDGKLAFPGGSTPPASFYAVQEDTTSQSPSPLWSFREVATGQYVSLDQGSGTFLLTTDADQRTLFARVARSPNREDDPAFPQQVGMLREGQAALFSLYDFSQTAWVVEQGIPDLAIFGGFLIDSVLLGPSTQLVLYEQPGFQGAARTVSASTSQLNPGGSQGLAFGSLKLQNIETAASELIEVSSELIYDRVYTTGSGFGPSTPLYRVVLQHRDGQGQLLQYEPVQVLADEPVTVSIGGQSYALSPGQPVQARSGGSGDLILLVAPTGEGLSVPALKVQTANMSPFSWVLIHPDEDIIEKLAVVTGDELLNGIPGSGPSATKSGLLSTGTTLDGAQAIAAALNNAARIITYDDGTPSDIHPDGGLKARLVGGTRSALLTPPRRPSARPSAMAVPHWSLRFEANGQPRFTRYASTDEALTAFFANAGRASPVHPAPSPVLGSARPRVMGFIDDIWDELEDTASDILDWTVSQMNAAASQAKALVDSALAFVRYVKGGIEYIAEVALDTAQRVCQFAKLLFDKLGVALAKVLDFFAFLFDWERIKALQQTLQDTIGSARVTMNQGAQQFLSSARDSVKAWLQSQDASLDSVIQSLRSRLGFDTPTIPTDPPVASAIRSLLPLRHSPLSWLTSKLTELMPDETGPTFSFSSVNEQTLQSGLEKQWTALTNPNLLLNQKPISLKDMIDAVLSGKVSDLNNLTDALWVTFQAFDVLGHGVLSTVEDMVDGFFDMLLEAITATGEMLDQPVPLPFFLDLLRDLLGWNSVTLLELMSLLIAVPAALAEGVQSLSLEAGAPRGGELSHQTRFNLLGAVDVVRTVFETSQDLIDGVRAMGEKNLPSDWRGPITRALITTWWEFAVGGQVVLDLARQAVTAPPSPLSVDSAGKGFWWASFIRPLLRSGLGIAAGNKWSVAAAGPYIASALGVMSLIFTAIETTESSEDKPKETAESTILCIPQIFKPLRTPQMEEATKGISLGVLLGLDLVCYAACFTLSFVIAAQDSGAEAQHQAA